MASCCCGSSANKNHLHSAGGFFDITRRGFAPDYSMSLRSYLIRLTVCIPAAGTFACGTSDGGNAAGAGTGNAGAGGSVNPQAGAAGQLQTGGSSGVGGSSAGAGGASGSVGVGGTGGAQAGAAGRAGSGGGGAAQAGASGSAGAGAGAGAGNGGSGGSAPSAALDQACTAACALQTKLACTLGDACHDACITQGELMPSMGKTCATQFTAMAQCEAKLTASKWICSSDENVPEPADGQCTSTVCPWACCVSSLYTTSDVWARCETTCH
jgi:hypothetical protein